MAPNVQVQTHVTRLLIGAVAVLAAVGFLVAALTARALPDQYPIHFDISGRPDRWVRGVGAEWYLLPVVGALQSATLTGLALVLPRLPTRALNLPRKEAFLRLPPEAQAPIYRAISHTVLALALLLSAQFTAIQLAMFGSALRGALGPFVLVPFAGLAATLAAAIAMTVRIGRKIRRATEEQAPGGPAAR